MAKIRFSIWRDCHPVPNVLLCIKFYQNDFSLKYGNLMTCNMVVVRHIEISKFRLCHVSSIIMLLSFCMQNVTKIGQSADELLPKNDF